MSSRINTDFKQYITQENFVYLLLFLFPIAGMSVSHWLTNIYNLLFLVSLFGLKGRTEKLIKEERVFLFICVGYMSIYILSSLINSWGEMQTRYLGTELRFLMIVPIYLLLRCYPGSALWLLRGSIVGAFVIFGQAYYDVFIRNLPTAIGVYSKNILGPLAALFVIWLLIDWRIEKKRIAMHVVYALAIAASLAAMAWSGSRGAYVGLIVGLVSWALLYIKGRWVFASVAFVMLLLSVVYNTSTIVKNRMDIAFSEYETYYKYDDQQKVTNGLSSVGTRLEMARATQYFLSDAPVWGVGPGNYRQVAQQYVDNGLVNAEIARHGHPHNAYLEALFSKGFIGLISLLLLMYYPLYYFLKTYKQSRETANLGTIHILAFSAFMLTDASPILMNNFSSILLLGLAVFFSWHVSKVKGKT